MGKIAIVYWSGTGNTEAMANAVSDGATKAGAQAELINAADFNAMSASGYSAIAFGCRCGTLLRVCLVPSRLDCLAHTAGEAESGWSPGKTMPQAMELMSFQLL